MTAALTALLVEPDVAKLIGLDALRLIKDRWRHARFADHHGSKVLRVDLDDKTHMTLSCQVLPSIAVFYDEQYRFHLTCDDSQFRFEDRMSFTSGDLRVMERALHAAWKHQRGYNHV